MMPKLAPRVCRGCGRTFQPKRSVVRFCSASCAGRYQATAPEYADARAFRHEQSTASRRRRYRREAALRVRGKTAAQAYRAGYQCGYDTAAAWWRYRYRRALEAAR